MLFTEFGLYNLNVACYNLRLKGELIFKRTRSYGHEALLCRYQRKLYIRNMLLRAIVKLQIRSRTCVSFNRRCISLHELTRELACHYKVGAG
jgi:hypothetical protein